MQIIKPLSGPKFLGAVFVFVRNVEFISKQPCLYFFVTPVQIQCPSLYTFLLTCIPSPPISLFFFISGYLLRTPDNSIFFSICLEGSSYRELSASYPDVSLSMKICAQRKAGRSLYPSHGPLRLIASRSPLPCEKRSAWGGGWGVMISTKTGKILVTFPVRALRPSPQNFQSFKSTRVVDQWWQEVLKKGVNGFDFTQSVAFILDLL